MNQNLYFYYILNVEWMQLEVGFRWYRLGKYAAQVKLSVYAKTIRIYE